MRSQLGSRPFLLLYVSAFAAVMLNCFRSRWSAAGWFPIAVGIDAGIILVALGNILEEAAKSRTRRPSTCLGRSIIGVVLILVALAGVWVATRMELKSRRGITAATVFVVFSLAELAFGLALLFQWPPSITKLFEARQIEDEEEDEDLCPSCGHERPDFGDFCPACGVRFDRPSPEGE